MHVNRKVTELGKGFSLEKVFIIQGTEMGPFIIAKLLYQINKRENCNILCLQAFKLALKVGRQSSTTTCSLFAGSLSSGGKIVVPFTKRSSSSNQTQNSRVEYKKKIKQLNYRRDFLLAGKKKTIESFR